MKGRKAEAALLALAVLVFSFAMGGCPSSTSPAIATTATTYVYAVDTISGKVFQIDRSTNTAASTPLVTIGQNASGEIRFYGNTGFVAVGSSSNTAPGLYYFDASSSSPSAARIGSALSAQYICVASSTLGYLTVANYSDTSLNGVYSFNPSVPALGLTAVYVDSASYPQDVVMGSDGYLYAVNAASTLGGTDTVLRIDTATEGVTVITVTGSGATGLCAGTYNGNSGVFVAETGGYSAGSIDFIASGATAVTPVISKSSGQVFARAAQFNSSMLIATGGYPAKTYLVSLSGTPTANEVKSGSTSFGSMDVDIYDGIAYVPDYAQSVYAIDANGTVTRISAGTSADAIANVGIGTITVTQ